MSGGVICFGRTLVSSPEIEPGSPQQRSQPALPTEGNLRRSCGAQAHSPYVMEKQLSPDVQSVPGDFFFPSTACTCIIEPSPTVPEPACSSFLFDLMLSGKRALVRKCTLSSGPVLTPLHCSAPAHKAEHYFGLGIPTTPA